MLYHLAFIKMLKLTFSGKKLELSYLCFHPKRNIWVKFLVPAYIAEKDFSDISNTFSFYNIIPLENSETGSCVIILNSTKSYAKVIEVTGLDNSNNNYTISPIPYLTYS